MTAHIVYRKNVFLIVVFSTLFIASMELIFLYLVKSRILSLIFLLLIVVPIFCIPLLLTYFTKKIKLEFYVLSFTVESSKGNVIISKKEIELKNISSYSIRLPTNNFSDIKFKMKDGTSFSYSFSKKRKAEDDCDCDELIALFHSSINNYNHQVSNENKISFLPSFYASFSGLIVITTLSVLLIISMIVISSIKGTSSIPFTFVFAVLIIFQLISKRKKELDYYKKTTIN